MISSRKYIFSLFFWVGIVPVCALPSLNIKERVMRSLGRIGDGIENIIDFCGFEEVGYVRLKPENEVFVQNILKEMGIMRRVCIRKMSKHTKRFTGYAFIVDFGVINYMFVDEALFESLDADEKRHLIGHEAAHIARWHAPLRGIAGSLIALPIANYLSQTLFNGKRKHCIQFLLKEDVSVIETIKRLVFLKDKALEKDSGLHEVRVEVENNSLKTTVEHKLESKIIIPTYLLTLKFLTGFISRMIEKDADCYAASKLHSAEGGVKLLKKMIEDEDPQSRFSIKRAIYGMYRSISELFTTHPPLDVRVRYLERMHQMEQQTHSNR